MEEVNLVNIDVTPDELEDLAQRALAGAVNDLVGMFGNFSDNAAILEPDEFSIELEELAGIREQIAQLERAVWLTRRRYGMHLAWEEVRYVITGRGCQTGEMTSVHDHLNEAETPADARELLETVRSSCATMLEVLEEWEAEQPDEEDADAEA